MLIITPSFEFWFCWSTVIKSSSKSSSNDPLVPCASLKWSNTPGVGLQDVVFQWVRKPLGLMYFFWQVGQVYGRSLVWRRLCNFKCTNCVNFDEHKSQAYGFWPLCRRKWVFKLLVLLNLLLHTSHWWGFSPEKTNFKVKNLLEIIKLSLKNEPVWIKWCFCKCASCVNSLPHAEHRKGRSP